LGDIFSAKISPNAKKYLPNGEMSPNLVTLLAAWVGLRSFFRL
jgi:hypothetical protein